MQDCVPAARCRWQEHCGVRICLAKRKLLVDVFSSRWRKAAAARGSFRRYRMNWRFLLALETPRDRSYAGIRQRRIVSGKFVLRKRTGRKNKPKSDLSLDFADLHAGVDGEIGIANERASRSGKMACRGSEIAARTLDGIGIAVAFSACHGD